MSCQYDKKLDENVTFWMLPSAKSYVCFKKGCILRFCNVTFLILNAKMIENGHRCDFEFFCFIPIQKFFNAIAILRGSQKLFKNSAEHMEKVAKGLGL